MSFVIAAPELVQSAAQSLAGIGSSLAEVTGNAAGPTTGLAAVAHDEVSAAIASIFGDVGQEFQALMAQAQTFQQQFASLMTAGAGAYASTEAANAAQAVLGGQISPSLGDAIASAETAFGQLGNGGLGALVGGQTGAQAISNAIASSSMGIGTLPTGGAAAVIDGITSFGATVAAPYQALVSNTATNLQGIGDTVTATLVPSLQQLANDQISYAQTIATGIQNLPAELANLPVTIQTGIQGLATVNPGDLLQQSVNQQIGYAQTDVTALQNAGNDLVTGLSGLPASFQAAGQALAVGDTQGAMHAAVQGLENVVLPGYNAVVTEPNPDSAFAIVGLMPQGPLGDLAPIFAIPGQMAQSVTNLLPPGSLPAQMAQHATNVIGALTDFSTTSTHVTWGQDYDDVRSGVGLQLLLDGIGGPANALAALNSTGLAFTGALQAGNWPGAAATLLNAPAHIANGFLNGQTAISLPPVDVSVAGIDVHRATTITLGGILAPLTMPTMINGSGDLVDLQSGTPVGGLIPGLQYIGSQLAGWTPPNVAFEQYLEQQAAHQND